ncbi:MAG: hypothetical protein H0T78_11335 [Longispora sp.]|nr:hypothetical protein [Longispora sp. (in: high G+C Gram-positive bacteria)]
MFKRLLWLGIGVGVGVVVVRRLVRTADAFTPSGIVGGLSNSANGMLGSVRSFVEDVRSAAAEREAEIHAAFAGGEMLTDYEMESDEH